MTNILVTGGAGFIGGHLVKRLTDNLDNHVHIIDNLSSNPVPLDVLLNDLNHPCNLTYEIAPLDTWLVNRPEPEWDIIYHLAAPVGPAGILQHGGVMAYHILHDTMAIIDMAKRCQCRLVDVSTSEVYGGGQAGYCSETMPRVIQAKTTIRLEYAVGKLAAETALINQCALHNLDAVIIRPFNVSGPRQSGKGGFVLPRFVAQAMTGLPLTVFGDGSQIRAFTHVYDIVEGIMRVAEAGKTGTAYNIGNPANKTTIEALAEKVIEIIGRGEISHVDPTTIYGPHYAEAADKYPDASRAMAEVDWLPRFTIAETIRSVYHYMTFSEPDIFRELAGFDEQHPVWERNGNGSTWNVDPIWRPLIDDTA